MCCGAVGLNSDRAFTRRILGRYVNALNRCLRRISDVIFLLDVLGIALESSCPCFNGKLNVLVIIQLLIVADIAAQGDACACGSGIRNRLPLAVCAGILHGEFIPRVISFLIVSTGVCRDCGRHYACFLVERKSRNTRFTWSCKLAIGICISTFAFCIFGLNSDTDIVQFRLTAEWIETLPCIPRASTRDIVQIDGFSRVGFLLVPVCPFRVSLLSVCKTECPCQIQSCCSGAVLFVCQRARNLPCCVHGITRTTDKLQVFHGGVRFLADDGLLVLPNLLLGGTFAGRRIHMTLFGVVVRFALLACRMSLFLGAGSVYFCTLICICHIKPPPPFLIF